MTWKNHNVTRKIAKPFSVILILLAICFQTLSTNIRTYAQSSDKSPAAIITVLSRDKTSLNKIKAKIELCFLDPSLYNDYIYLSYHVYGKISENGEEELVAFENPRYKVVLDETNKFFIEIDIVFDNEKYKELYVEFDIVDEINAYWFGLVSPPILQSENIIYKYDLLYSLVEPIINSFFEQPVILIINIILFALFILVTYYIVHTKSISFSVNKQNTKHDQGVK